MLDLSKCGKEPIRGHPRPVQDVQHRSEASSSLHVSCWEQEISQLLRASTTSLEHLPNHEIVDESFIYLDDPSSDRERQRESSFGSMDIPVLDTVTKLHDSYDYFDRRLDEKKWPRDSLSISLPPKRTLFDSQPQLHDRYVKKRRRTGGGLNYKSTKAQLVVSDDKKCFPGLDILDFDSDTSSSNHNFLDVTMEDEHQYSYSNLSHDSYYKCFEEDNVYSSRWNLVDNSAFYSGNPMDGKSNLPDVYQTATQKLQAKIKQAKLNIECFNQVGNFRWEYEQ